MAASRILIVDDDPSIRDLLDKALLDDGFDTRLASDGRDALDMIDADAPDLMILDLMMPRVSGWDVLARLPELSGPPFPVLILSAQRPDASILRALEGDLRDFVGKPFDLSELLIRIRALLGRAPAVAQPLGQELRVYALGSLRVFRGETLLFDESWRNRPAKTIFKMLFTTPGQRYPKDVLVEELWPETEPEPAANRLRVAVHELRKIMGGRRKGDKAPAYIGQQEGAYFFDAALPYWSDVQLFQALVRRGRTVREEGDDAAALQAYREAEELYQGDYLRDDPFLEWTISLRERLREEHLTMLAEAAELLARRGDPAEAAGFCRRILRIEPWREEVYRHLMQYLTAAGRPHEALRAFEECRRALHSEIEAQPSSQTIELRDRIASGT